MSAYTPLYTYCNLGCYMCDCRRPVHYQSIINNGQQPVLGNRAQATVNRYKYYTKLASHSGSTMVGWQATMEGAPNSTRSSWYIHKQ